MKKSIPQILTGLCLRFWPWILVVGIVFSLMGLKPTAQLFKNISSDPIDLLPKNQPNVLTLLEMRKKFEKSERSRIIIESDNREANVRFIDDIAKSLEQQPYIDVALYQKPGFSYFDEAKLLFLKTPELENIRDRIEKKIQKEKMLGLYIDFDEPAEKEESFQFSDLENKYKSEYTGMSYSPYYESKDGRIFFLTAAAPMGETGLAAATKFHENIEAFVKTLNPKAYDPGMQVYLSVSTKVSEYRALMSDLTKVGIISSILIFIPLLFRFFNPLHVFWIFFPLFIGIPISFAITSQFIPKLNVCTSFLFAILGALGIENGIHIFSRYYEGRVNGLSLEEGITEIFSKTARAIVISVASVAATFLVLVINDFRGFSEFGMITGVGLWVIFFVYFSVLPALLIGLDRFNLIKFKKKSEEVKTWFFPKSMVNVIFALGLLFAAFSLYVAPGIQFEFDSQKTKAVIPEVEKVKKKMDQLATRVNNPAALLLKDEPELQKVKTAVSGIIAQKKTPILESVKSYDDVLPKDQDQKIIVLRQIDKLLNDKTFKLLGRAERDRVQLFREAIAKTRTVTEKDIPQEVKAMFKGKEEILGEVLFINPYPRIEMDNGRNAMSFARDISKVTVDGKTYYPSNDAIVYGKVLETMLGDAPRVMIIAFFLIFFFVYMDFRNFLHAGIVMTSIVFGVIWMLGLMWVWDVQINFYNMIIIPAILGMSIDNSIHIFHRYRELGRGSLPQVMATSGSAALIASLTNASAFIGLLFCTHGGLFSIGLLAVIGVCTCLLSTLVFFPIMLYVVENRSARVRSA